MPQREVDENEEEVELTAEELLPLPPQKAGSGSQELKKGKRPGVKRH